MSGPILFLDLATTTGWCDGVPGERPTSGTIRLAGSGGPNPEAYDTIYQFMDDRLRLTRYQMIAIEAPQSPSHMAGRTNVNTARRLIGLCEVVEWVAYRHGYFGRRMVEARVDDVRRHLFSGSRPPKGEAKAYVIDRVKALGYAPADDNEADAIAGWLYASGIVGSKIAQMTTPLFNQKP